MEYLKKYPDLNELDRAQATCFDDAFDALVSAFHMFEHRESFARLAESHGNRRGVTKGGSGMRPGEAMSSRFIRSHRITPQLDLQETLEAQFDPSRELTGFS